MSDDPMMQPNPAMGGDEMNQDMPAEETEETPEEETPMEEPTEQEPA